MKALTALAVALALLTLAGCATFSKDGGFGAIEQVAKDRLNQDVRNVRSDDEAESVRAEVAKRLAQPLSVDDAVQVALLNNRGLQATYAELGIAEAELVQAGRLPNPRFSYLHTSNQATGHKIESIFTLAFIDVLTMPLRLRIERRRFEAVKLGVANEVLIVAAQTRRAYFEALAAEQSVQYLRQVREAAEASAELARRMAQVGNFSKLSQLREQVFYADAAAQLARSRQASVVARERLIRLMGLWGSDTQFKLPERLPDLPPERPELANIEPYAIAERLDIRSATLQTQSVASALGLSRATRFINVLEFGPARTKEGFEPSRRGYEIAINIPIFDWGGAQVARAEAIYMQAVNRVAQTAVDARSEVREAYSDYQKTYELAKHYRDEVVPLRRKIADENQLRYNGMFISVFELLADAREQVLAVNAYIESLKDFWVAEAELQRSVGGRLPASAMRMGGPPASALKPSAAPPAIPSTPSEHKGH